MSMIGEALILNVDDNDGARYAKTRILSRAGFDVIEAATGEEALAKVRLSAPELVLLDVKLPDINGLEVCRRIKTDPQTFNTLVLQTSAAAVHSIDKVRALDGGADSYLTEPVDPAELIANVRALLRLRRAERALRESEERFRQLAENIDDVFWIIDPETRAVLYVSPAYRTLWGREPPIPGIQAAAAGHWSPGVHPDDAERVARAFEQLSSVGQYEEEFRIVRPDGRVSWIRERGFPVRDEKGPDYSRFDEVGLQGRGPGAAGLGDPLLEVGDGGGRGGGEPGAGGLDSGGPNGGGLDGGGLANGSRGQATDHKGRIYRLAGVATDISERKATELLLREADRRKDQFLAMLAHELRNPLAPIRNAVEIMQPSRTPDPQAAERARAIIARQVNHLSRLVDDLLDVSRITQGKVTLKVESVALNAAVAAALETARPAIEKKRHTLDVMLPPEPLYLRGDAVRIAQIIGNLVSNASKYTPEGGRIAVHATVEGSEDNGGHGSEIVIRVRDDGVGIAPEMLPHIFELFVQSESSLGRSEGGLGIGLPLAKTLVELHGGRINAVSGGIGLGSEFTLWLPLVQAIGAYAPAPEPEPPAEPPPAQTSLDILLVDDSIDAAVAMGLLLETLGHQVRTMHDGVAALEAAQESVPQVVILDIGLPGMDGFEVARNLRCRPEMADALLIAVTGYGQASDRQLARDAGFDLHFVKPVSFAAIEDALDSAFAPGHTRNRGAAPAP